MHPLTLKGPYTTTVQYFNGTSSLGLKNIQAFKKLQYPILFAYKLALSRTLKSNPTGVTFQNLPSVRKKSNTTSFRITRLQ